MFAAPRTGEQASFARLPEEYKTSNEDNEWVATQPLGSPQRSLLEGPSFDRDGNLWCVDILNGRIFARQPTGRSAWSRSTTAGRTA